MEILGTISMSIPPPRTADLLNPPTGAGPQAHEDLTIAEHLESIRIRDEHRPGELCFSAPDGEHRWFPESEVKNFIASHGADHPSGFLTSQGTDWQHTFFRI